MDFCELLAEEELVEVVPNFKFPKQINLISGTFGPFQPTVPIKVPLWMALNLQRQHKCTINIPKWVSELMKAAEAQDDKNTLLEIPNESWREIVKLLEQYCDLLPYCPTLVERRDAIIRSSVHNLFEHASKSQAILISDVSVHNVSKGELYAIKYLVQRAFSHFQKLRMLAHETSSR